MCSDLEEAGEPPPEVEAFEVEASCFLRFRTIVVYN